MQRMAPIFLANPHNCALVLSELNALGKHGKKLLHNLLPALGKKGQKEKKKGKKGNCKVNEIEKQNAAFA